ncbi:hypothetical protein HNQ80_003776 [Anaerosolibacter carboniphilus]|uniref:DUF5132 domain-containing protein n=1 Tax=Anaerosolibacter carboniphilus TaxID=1417629 RepID=A0A841KWA3_9FIRM|nr:hypothetical protein [Anaerosolibacter carboniphilus]MBB6217653.1 hypothetical protein [Anaerosolibacter carboniphilus]
MEPLGFILGVVTFNAFVRAKEPIRKATIMATSQVMNIAEHAKGAVYGIKEEVEDIIAEAHYENMKRNMTPLDYYQGEVDQQFTEH